MVNSALGRVLNNGGGSEVYYFLKFLVSTEELLEEFDNINPIVPMPLGINVFHPFQAIVEGESISTLIIKAATGAAKTIQESIAMLCFCKYTEIIENPKFS